MARVTEEPSLVRQLRITMSKRQGFLDKSQAVDALIVILSRGPKQSEVVQVHSREKGRSGVRVRIGRLGWLQLAKLDKIEEGEQVLRTAKEL